MVFILVIFTLTIGPWLLIYVGLLFEENPPKPKYTYGEFPFHLEYEINGQRMIVEDTVIVKFDGFRAESGIGSKKKINWKQSLKSGKKDVIFFQDGDSEKIYLNVREEDYKLEDEIRNRNYNNDIPFIMKEVDDGRYISGSVISEHELYSNYKIKLIKFEYEEILLR